MILDFSSSPVGNQVVLFPEYVFTPQPLDPDQIIETSVIKGTNTGVTLGGTGTIDDPG